jgi:hypothetical protein
MAPERRGLSVHKERTVLIAVIVLAVAVITAAAMIGESYRALARAQEQSAVSILVGQQRASQDAARMQYEASLDAIAQRNLQQQQSQLLQRQADSDALTRQLLSGR